MVKRVFKEQNLSDAMEFIRKQEFEFDGLAFKADVAIVGLSAEDEKGNPLVLKVVHEQPLPKETAEGGGTTGTTECWIVVKYDDVERRYPINCDDAFELIKKYAA